MTKKIPLSGGLGVGRYALVDDADFEQLSRYTWYFAKRPRKNDPNAGYAARSIKCASSGKWKDSFMHREILGLSKGEEADHVDNDGLNNQRRNLRLVSHYQNSLNRRKYSRGARGTSSQYKGVYFSARPGRQKRWTAAISVNGKRESIGYFYTETEAAAAYDEAAIRLHGDFASLNFG